MRQQLSRLPLALGSAVLAQVAPQAEILEVQGASATGAAALFEPLDGPPPQECPPSCPTLGTELATSAGAAGPGPAVESPEQREVVMDTDSHGPMLARTR